MSNSDTFRSLLGLSQGNVTTESAYPLVSGGTVRGLITPPSNLSINLFRVRAIASATSGTTSNFTLNVYWNAGVNTNLTTFTSDVLLIGSGTQALASVSGIVVIEANVTYDDVSGRVAAWWNDSAGIANIATTPAVIKTAGAITATNPLTTLSTTVGAFGNAINSLQFFATALFGTSNASNATVLKELSIEKL